MNWLEQHADDTDLNEQLFIVGQEGAGEIKEQYHGGLSKEERIKNAEAKIAAARKQRAIDEKINAQEAERNRIVNDKLMAAAKRENAEKEIQQGFAERKKEKEELLAAKKKMLI